MSKFKIGILGTGDVGAALGTGFINLAHEVMMGGRETDNARAEAWVKKQPGKATQGTFADAAKYGEMLVLATLGSANESVIKLAGVDNIADKILIDATNPMEMTPNGPRLYVGHTDSGGEQVQRWAPRARVVKAFNTVGSVHMVKPTFAAGPPDMFLCGNDAAAKRQVENICSHFGWGTIDMGGIDAARYLEPLSVAWVLCGVSGKSWNHAFKVLRK